MKTRVQIGRALLVLGCLLASCREPDPVGEAPPQSVAVPIVADVPHTRSFQNDGTHHVDRIVAIPFRKTSETLADDDRNYVPAYTLAVQRDVTAFPETGLVLHLPVGVTYKVLVIGYARGDYDYNNRSNPANRFDLGSLLTPATLADFHLYPKSPTAVPEIFTCLCTARNGATEVGTAFRPEQRYTLTGTLGRLVSGLSVTITGIPGFVKAVSLTAENLTRVSRATDAGVLLSQSTGDGGSRLIARKTPTTNRRIAFDCYLLPTFDARATRFYLDVEYGAYTKRYVVKVPDSSVSADNRLALKPNQAINISGLFSSIQTGFNIGPGINLDDDDWDGIH